jgi:hypothetical protein
MKTTTTVLSCLFAVLSVSMMKYSGAAHPLVTDDTGNQGTGKSQIEINTDRAESFDGSRHRVAAFTYTYGVKDALDVFGTLPATLTSSSGINDASFGFKWRLWQHGHTSMAIKPEVALPTGNANKELGNGRAGAAFTLLASHDAAPWSFHGNAGVSAHRYKIASARESRHRYIWRASMAAAYAFSPHWTLIADTGVARRIEAATSVNPAFFLLGMIYSPRDDVQIDVGVKAGLNEAEVRRQFGAGITLRF